MEENFVVILTCSSHTFVVKIWSFKFWNKKNECEYFIILETTNCKKRNYFSTKKKRQGKKVNPILESIFFEKHFLMKRNKTNVSFFISYKVRFKSLYYAGYDVI